LKTFYDRQVDEKKLNQSREKALDLKNRMAIDKKVEVETANQELYKQSKRTQAVNLARINVGQSLQLRNKGSLQMAMKRSVDSSQISDRQQKNVKMIGDSYSVGY